MFIHRIKKQNEVKSKGCSLNNELKIQILTEKRLQGLHSLIKKKKKWRGTNDN